MWSSRLSPTHRASTSTVAEAKPELCIIDVRLPPSWTDEGIRAALSLRAARPELAVLVLSQYVEERYAAELIAASGGSLGYLLKDRVADVADFLERDRPDRGGRHGARPGSRRAAAQPPHQGHADAATHRS